MTPDQIKKVASRYIEYLSKHVEVPTRFVLTGQVPTPEQARAHVWWMCDEITRQVDADQVDKAYRWLGFAQGVLWTLGHKSLKDLRDDNR